MMILRVKKINPGFRLVQSSRKRSMYPHFHQKPVKFIKRKKKNAPKMAPNWSRSDPGAILEKCIFIVGSACFSRC